MIEEMDIYFKIYLQIFFSFFFFSLVLASGIRIIEIHFITYFKVSIPSFLYYFYFSIFITRSKTFQILVIIIYLL